MNLRIFNTLTGKKDIFKPINKKVHPVKSAKGGVLPKAKQFNRVNLFVCGPTVYDYSHLGHARNYVIFDAFAKYLKQIGFKVFYLQNITDVDDKIIARAREKGVPAKDLALAFEKEYIKDMKILGINSVAKYAKATSHIKEIISQIKRLEAKGFAYKIEGDGIYYDISKFKNYGKFAGRTALQAEDAVSRIDYSNNKRNRGDFCLWKITQEDGEPSWKSPFGRGRPGWHIEDTAITEKFFGPQYDIHGAARDLIFPHHQAEIAQMEAVSGKAPMAKYWMHVGFLTVNGQKMSKSLGNFIIIRDFLRRYSVNYLRYLIVKNLWSSPLDYSESAMIEVKAAMEKIEEFLRKIQEAAAKKQTTGKNIKLIKKLKTDFYEQLADNFNTPKAFAVLFDFIKEANQLLDNNLISKAEANQIYKFFAEINNIFGIIDFKNLKISIPANIKKLANEREKCRKTQNWQEADRLRMEIEKQGYAVEDTKNGSAIKKI